MTAPDPRPAVSPGRYAPGDWITIAQSLQVLPCGKSTLYALVGQGVLPSIRVTSVGSRRGRVLLLRKGIEDYIDRLRAAPAARPPVRVDVDALRNRILARSKARGTSSDPCVDNGRSGS